MNDARIKVFGANNTTILTILEEIIMNQNHLGYSPAVFQSNYKLLQIFLNCLYSMICDSSLRFAFGS